MTINAAKHHNYIVRAIGGEKIKYVNEIIQGIESNKGEIKALFPLCVGEYFHSAK